MICFIINLYKQNSFSNMPPSIQNPKIGGFTPKKPDIKSIIKIFVGFCVAIIMIYLGWAKRNIYFCEWLGWGCGATTQKENLYVNGRDLFSITDQKIILRGVNLAFDDKNLPKALQMISSIDSTGANCIRLVVDSKFILSKTAFFDQIITKIADSKMIPIVELHDKTCEGLTKENIDFLVGTWLHPSMLPILKKHQKYLILNIGNEVGDYENIDNNALSIKLFNAYESGITNIRNAGLNMPIMIDAPFCGKNIDAVEMTANRLINHDSKKNLLFAVHLYDDDATNSEYVENTILLDTYNKNIPFVVGEFSIAKDCDPSEPNLDYQTMLRVCQEKQIGWIAWVWSNVQLNSFNESVGECPIDNESSTRLNMTKLTGNFKDLRGWGEIVATSSPYSIKNTSKRIPLR